MGLPCFQKLVIRHGLLKAVIVSAYGDMDNIRMAMEQRAFGFYYKAGKFWWLWKLLCKNAEAGTPDEGDDEGN